MNEFKIDYTSTIKIPDYRNSEEFKAYMKERNEFFKKHGKYIHEFIENDRKQQRMTGRTKENE